ncbi:MAG TPA: HypC/HybG/HupF family hydrogenase formation chaperone [Candidatus Acetothermia bacterium]|nr:HypC/HybG/HupF family hydrogenase formation chaperone [Candidatus Acetothermia bacterium]
MCLAVPAKVLSVEGNRAIVDLGGTQAQARLDALAEEVRVGDYLLVHTGFAIRRLDPEDAQETLRLFAELLQALEGEDDPHTEP